MNRTVKVILWLPVVGLVLFLFLLFGGAPWVFEAGFHLAIGWMFHASTVLPKVVVNWSGVGMLLVCVSLTAFIGHRFCRWLWQGTGHAEPWRLRWTLAGIGTLVLMFAAGMAFTAVAHQTGWMFRSDERLVKSGWSNERNASTSLKTLASAQADFRSNDRDDNKIYDYWRGDVAGLYTVKGADGRSIKLIELSVAAADWKPVTDISPYGVRSPKAGHWFKALKFPNETTPDPQRWAACAFPDSLSAGKYMFIISDENTIYRKPAELPLPEVYPDDPVKEGWTKLD